MIGLLVVFVAGYIMGANSGAESYGEVVDALHAIRKSEEFAALVSALRSHAGATLHHWAELVEEQPSEPLNPTRLLERVRDLMARTAVAEPPR